MKRVGWCVVIVVCGLAAGAWAVDVDPVGTTAEAPAEAPAESPAGGLDSTDPALVEFARHFSGHEPIYFLAGTKAPNVKFQVSFKYAVANPEAPLVKKFPALEGINLAYTQTSLWDTSDESAPFFDSSYKPEVLWSDEYIPALSRRGAYGLGLQFGMQHESNGKGGLDSRSLNIAYVRPVFTLGDPRDFRLTVAPRVFTYLGGQGDNEDIENYRGYADLRAKVGWRDGLELSALGRLGDDWDRGSIQLDLTYPLRKLFFGNLDVYLDVQGFYGHGESLLGYNRRTSALRFGIAVVR
jgi:outer membrane phospholipase A